MDQIEMLKQAHEVNTRLFAGVKPAQLEESTPCEDWNVRELMNHMVGGAWMFGMAAARKAMPEGDPPSDFLGEDAVAAWQAASAANLDGWATEGSTEGEVELPFGKMPAEVAAGINLLEACVHGWDLAKATGQGYEAPPEIAETVLAFSRQLVTEETRQSGAFGAEVEVPADAPAIDRLAGFLGRKG